MGAKKNFQNHVSIKGIIDQLGYNQCALVVEERREKNIFIQNVAKC